MKNKQQSKPIQANKEAIAGKTDVEAKLQAVVQRIRNNPSIVAVAIILVYCVVRLALSI